MSRQSEIVNLVRTLHLSSSDVSDALGRRGRLTRATQMSGDHSVVGPVFHVAAVDGSNWFVHKLLHDVPPGVVVYVGNHGCGDLALVGGLICEYVMSRHALAVVVDGNIRDVEQIRKKNLPVWACGSNPVVCTKEPASCELHLNSAVAVCDATGVVFIESDDMTAEFEENLKKISNREKSWFRQLRDGKTTFQITCDDI